MNGKFHVIQGVFSGGLNLNDLVVRNAAATFFIQVDNDAYKISGMYSGDILVVDRSVTPKIGNRVVVVINEKFKIRKLIEVSGGLYLKSDSCKDALIKVDDLESLVIWGAITYILHKEF